MKDDFDCGVDEWLDELEVRLGSPGRQTPPDQEDEGATDPPRPVISDPSTLVPRRPVMSSVRRPQSVAPEPEPDPEVKSPVRPEAQLTEQRRELVRTEALVQVMKELAGEIRSVRRDVDQIKAFIAKLRRLTKTKKREMAGSVTTTIGPNHSGS